MTVRHGVHATLLLPRTHANTGSISDGEDAKKGRSADQDMRGMWFANHLAQEMGPGLG